MNKLVFIVLFFCLFETTVFAQSENPKKKEFLVIGPKNLVRKDRAGISCQRKHVVYFQAEMYKKGILEKVEFSFSSKSALFSEKGDTIGYKMPVMLKIYARDTVKNMPGEELLKDTVIIVPQKRKQKVQIDISKYGITLPAEGIYCGLSGFPYPWYIEHGYWTSDNTSYKTKKNHYYNASDGTKKPLIGGFSHVPYVSATRYKKEVDKYQNFVSFGKEWENANEMYHSTLVIRLYIRE